MKTGHQYIMGLTKLDVYPKMELLDFPDATVSYSNLQNRRPISNTCYVISEETENDNGSNGDINISNCDTVLVSHDKHHRSCGDNTNNNCAHVNQNSYDSSPLRLTRLPEFNNPPAHSPSFSPSTDVSFKDFNPESNHNSAEIKSGSLVLIEKAGLTKSRDNTPGSPEPALRCPVIVKIYQKSFHRFATIAHTRRHSSWPTLYLKLKNTRVSYSPANPAHFSLVVDGAEGRTFQFEANSPETARDWVHAFSCDTLQKTTHCHRQLSNIRHILSSLPESCIENVISSPRQIRNVPEKLSRPVLQMAALPECADEDSQW
ncbi:uncharacterized protein LOC131958072 [Physella acuta]|uniref:uncharacterized protein LOC131958072 n=1 Tax=Physella acuta TaxID=109671 RepID=UPI0027DCBA1C|nr:uncharacterized protein LOC131958072 [Physella acuta]